MLPILVFWILSFLLNFGLIIAAVIGCSKKKEAAVVPAATTTDNKTQEPVKTKTMTKSGANFVEDPDLKSRSNYNNVKSDGAGVPGT